MEAFHLFSLDSLGPPSRDTPVVSPPFNEQIFLALGVSLNRS